MKDLAKYITISILCVALGFFIFKSCNEEPEIEIVSETVEVDTTKIINKYKDSIKAELKANLKPEIQFKTIRDTIQEKVNIDSLWNEAKDYWRDRLENDLEDYTYSAIADTSYEDSTITYDIEFISPIPLHPESNFEIFIKQKVKEITKTITQEVMIEKPAYKEKSFWWAVGTTIVLLINLIWG